MHFRNAATERGRPEGIKLEAEQLTGIVIILVREDKGLD